MTIDVFGPVAIDDNRLAAMRQIHCAIEHLKGCHYEAAITLAAAAESMLPETEARHLRQPVKKMSKRPDIQDDDRRLAPEPSATAGILPAFNGSFACLTRGRSGVSI